MDDRTLELIHGDIDGVNDAEAQRELALRLESSAEARRELARLRNMREILAGETDFEPPAGLRSSIMAQIPAHAQRPAARVIPLRTRRTWFGAAAALAATAAGVALLLGRGPEMTELDPAVLAGTMVRSAAEASAPSLRLDDPSMTGEISLHSGEGRYAIEVELDAARPVVIQADAAGAQLEIEGFVPLVGEPAELSIKDGGIRLLHRGKQRYVLVLGTGGGAPSPIDFSVYEGGQLVRQGRLTWPDEIPGGRE